MPYQLSPELNERVQSFVFAGYRDEDDVLREALDALEAREQEKLRRWHEGNRSAAGHRRQPRSSATVWRMISLHRCHQPFPHLNSSLARQ